MCFSRSSGTLWSWDRRDERVLPFVFYFVYATLPCRFKRERGQARVPWAILRKVAAALTRAEDRYFAANVL